jgi:hypothetical protein
MQQPVLQYASPGDHAGYVGFQYAHHLLQWKLFLQAISFAILRAMANRSGINARCDGTSNIVLVV